MKTVHVVTCNDFPEAAFTDLGDAHAYILRKSAEDAEQLRRMSSRVNYWKTYHFELDKEVPK